MNRKNAGHKVDRLFVSLVINPVKQIECRSYRMTLKLNASQTGRRVTLAFYCCIIVRETELRKSIERHHNYLLKFNSIQNNRSNPFFSDSFFFFRGWTKTRESKIEKVPRGIRCEKSSKDMSSSRNLVSIIGAQASPTIGDGTRCPEG